MSSNSNSSSSITRSTRSSMVAKLNLRMNGVLLSVIFSINLLLVFLCMIAIFGNAEHNLSDLIVSSEFSDNYEDGGQNSFANYEISSTRSSFTGYVLPNFVQKQLSRRYVNGIREIGMSENEQTILSGWQRVYALKYSITSEASGSNFRFTYQIGYDFRIVLRLFFVLIIFEVFIIISEIIKTSRVIRKTLKPLYELAESARNLHEEVSSLGSKVEDQQLKVLAGEISGIDANRLNMRISVGSAQEELKDLASAINDMLTRVNDSYQSQVQFVSDASHELRTPISVIQGYVNLLDRWGKNDEKTMQESIDAIKAETQSMKELVEQLLFLARGDNETIQLNLESFDACSVIEETVREAQMIDANHEFKLQLDCPAWIHADKQLIKQAMRILVDNSCKYSPTGEAILLRVSSDKEHVRLTVQDNGIGIESESLPLIFNRFYRSDESRTRKTGGSGLGLAIARWIIERHGASFEILSRVDIGTRITIVLPTDLRIEEHDKLSYSS